MARISKLFGLLVLALCGTAAIAQDYVVLRQVTPEYPRRAAIAGTEGYVTMDFIIEPDGGVSDIKVTDAKPRRVFDRAAVRALSQWQFEPIVVDGERVSKQASITIDFNL